MHCIFSTFKTNCLRTFKKYKFTTITIVPKIMGIFMKNYYTSKYYELNGIYYFMGIYIPKSITQNTTMLIQMCLKFKAMF